MTWLARHRGGVRISFTQALVQDSPLQCQLLYPNIAGLTKAMLPKVYWRTNNQAAALVPDSAYITVPTGTLWMEFYLQYDGSEIMTGAQYQRPEFDGLFQIRLRADIDDMQLPDFGERVYNITYGTLGAKDYNGFVTAVPSGLSPGTLSDTKIKSLLGIGASDTEAAGVATFFTRKALVKERKLTIKDIAGNTIASNKSLQALNAQYPPNASQTKAPYPLITTPTYNFIAFASGNTYNNLTQCAGDAADGYVIPLNTRIVALMTKLPRNYVTNGLASQNSIGWTAATTLFDRARVETDDFGVWAPYFLGKDISFQTDLFYADANQRL